MARTKNLWIFKCAKGHKIETLYPLGTPIEDVDETTCAECLKTGAVERAYVVFICPAPKEKKDGGRS